MASFDTADAEPLRSGATSTRRAAELLALPDEALLEAFQRQTFGYFWEGAHGPSGLARDRHPSRQSAPNW